LRTEANEKFTEGAVWNTEKVFDSLLQITVFACPLELAFVI